MAFWQRRASRAWKHAVVREWAGKWEEISVARGVGAVPAYQLPGGLLHSICGLFWLYELRGGDILIVLWLCCGKLKRSVQCEL